MPVCNEFLHTWQDTDGALQLLLAYALLDDSANTHTHTQNVLDVCGCVFCISSPVFQIFSLYNSPFICVFLWVCAWTQPCRTHIASHISRNNSTPSKWFSRKVKDVTRFVLRSPVKWLIKRQYPLSTAWIIQKPTAAAQRRQAAGIQVSCCRQQILFPLNLLS